MQKKKNFYVRTAAIFICLCLLCPIFAVSADSYSRNEKADGNSVAVAARDTYTAAKRITADELGLSDALEGITEVFCSGDYVYILCGEESRIVVLNNDYSFSREIKVTQNGEELDFTGAQGIFVHSNSAIYIADTNNARILILSKDGEYTSEMLLPDSPLIPEDFLYQPSKILIDKKGYMYILAQGCYYGALMYSPDGEFLGFYGANTVKASALDTLEYLWDMLTSNDAKKAGAMKTLPYSFVDFCVDNDGYIITCSGTTEAQIDTTGQIRKLSPGGVNILYHRGTDGETVSSDSFNFGESKLSSRGGKPEYQNIVSVDVDTDGFIYTLDKTYGIIYVYDSECNLISAFGGENGDYSQKGSFTMPVSLALNGTDILVADSEEDSVTVFTRTEHGSLIHKAQTLYLNADYSEARDIWEQVVVNDSGCQIAYRGLAKLCYTEGDYKASVQYAKLGLDYATYDLAYQEILSDFIADNFAAVMIVAVLLLAGLVVLLILGKKKKLPKIKNRRLQAALGINIHPFGCFANIKQYKLGSVKIATAILFIYFIAQALQETCCGFAFRRITADSYNIIYTLAKTVGLIVLWSVANWLISSLFGGIGKLKDIYIVSCYCLVPLIVYKLLYMLLSHILPVESAGVLGVINTIFLIYVFFLLSVAIMEIHEYNFTKFLSTSVITVLGMILVVFIIFVLIILLQQLWNFIYSLYLELTYR